MSHRRSLVLAVLASAMCSGLQLVSSQIKLWCFVSLGNIRCLWFLFQLLSYPEIGRCSIDLLFAFTAPPPSLSCICHMMMTNCINLSLFCKLLMSYINFAESILVLHSHKKRALRFQKNDSPLIILFCNVDIIRRIPGNGNTGKTWSDAGFQGSNIDHRSPWCSLLRAFLRTGFTCS
jgi:hypothetical protein